MNYNAIDAFIVIVLGLSALLSLVRGGVYEVISATGWVLGFVVSALFAPALMRPYLYAIENQEVRGIVAHVMVFVIVVFLATIVAVSLRAVVRMVGLGGVDRILGIVMGLFKGLLVLIVLDVAAHYTELPKTKVWAQSSLHGVVDEAVVASKAWLPDGVAKYMCLSDCFKAEKKPEEHGQHSQAEPMVAAASAASTSATNLAQAVASLPSLPMSSAASAAQAATLIAPRLAQQALIEYHEKSVESLDPKAVNQATDKNTSKGLDDHSARSVHSAHSKTIPRQALSGSAPVGSP